MIAAAVLSLSLLSGGHGALGGEIYSPDTVAVIKKIVGDAARAEAAVRIIEEAKKESEATVKRAAGVAKQFQKVDARPETGLAEFEPFLESISAERRRGQKEALDSVFALRKTLTEEEWKAAFAGSR